MYALRRTGASRSHAVLILTSPEWNATMSQVGGVVVRQHVAALEEPHCVGLAGGDIAVCCAVVSLLAPSLEESPIGEAIRDLGPEELEQVEDRVAMFLRLPQLAAGRPLRPELPGDPARYPLWGDVYYAEPLIDDERKRYVIMSPNAWNAVAPYVSLVRTTSRDKANVAAFPLIEGGAARAACGDLSVRRHGEIIIDPRSRPTPRTVSFGDMSVIARGIARTHLLEGAISRLSP